MMYSKLHLLSLLQLLSVTHFREVASNLYKNQRLEEICYPKGRKKEIAVFETPHAFTFNSSLSSIFQCHLELELYSKKVSGFSVSIDYMNLEEDRQCSKDYLQFGGDVLFITTQTSKKRCGNIPPKIPVFKDNLPRGFKPDPFHSERHYRQNSDEMDIWLQIGRGVGKELSMTITPIGKCRKGGRQFWACPNSSECVRSQLFCDGKVNCITNSLDEDSRFCPNISGGFTVDSAFGIPMMIILAVGAVVFCIFGFFCVKEVLVRSRHTRSPPSREMSLDPVTQSRLSASQLEGGSVHGGGGIVGARELMLRDVPGHHQERGADLAQDDLPLNPPAYADVIAQSQDPPKYCDIEKSTPL